MLKYKKGLTVNFVDTLYFKENNCQFIREVIAMTIKEVEERTGLARSNIRFYEKERLIEPARNDNGYRDYSKEDVEIIKKLLICVHWKYLLKISAALYLIKYL